MKDTSIFDKLGIKAQHIDGITFVKGPRKGETIKGPCGSTITGLGKIGKMTNKETKRVLGDLIP